MDDLYKYNAVITNVVDGDTVDATIDVGFGFQTQQRLRLLGINCPEMHGAAHLAGQAAKDYTISRALNKSVVIQTHKHDSFGRWLATVWVDGDSLNAAILAAGHAIPFMVEVS